MEVALSGLIAATLIFCGFARFRLVKPAAGRAPVAAIQLELFDRRLPRQRDAVAVVVVVLADAAERRVLRELVVDAAAVEEIEDTEAAAHHGLALAGDVVGETDARAEVVVVVVDQRIPIAAGNPDGGRLQIEVGLSSGDFGRVGEDVVANAQVQRETAADAPVILDEDGVLPGARAEHAGLSADLVVLDEARQDVGRFIAGGTGANAVAPQEEVSLAGLGPEQVDFAANEVAAEFEQVIALGPAQAAGALVGVLGHLVVAVVAGVLELAVIPADQRSAAKQRTGVGVWDTQVLGKRHVCNRAEGSRDWCAGIPGADR